MTGSVIHIPYGWCPGGEENPIEEPPFDWELTCRIVDEENIWLHGRGIDTDKEGFVMFSSEQLTQFVQWLVDNNHIEIENKIEVHIPNRK